MHVISPPASYDGSVLLRRALVLTLLMAAAAPAQGIIDFESAGLKYKAMTLGGITVMFSVLPTRIRDYAVLQMAVSNGSSVSWTIEPEDCTFEKTEGQKVQALPA